ncbi:hypothetical protein [Aeromicrobium sp.]|uniref:hypothetical protein n=1 Tax=Aeromicrobium sp. TaxID=1871063 RepID=UPI003C6FDC32
MSLAAAASAMTTVAEPGHSAPEHQQLVAIADDNGMTLSECGDITMLCIAVMIGISAFDLLRRAARERVLAPVQNLSPLQRTAVLRC